VSRLPLRTVTVSDPVAWRVGARRECAILAPGQVDMQSSLDDGETHAFG
jgi:hypothetical protein